MNKIEDSTKQDAKFMRMALKYAKKAAKEGEVPVGAVVINNNEIVSFGYNKREQLQDPSAHAEFIALTKAAKKLNTWRLTDCCVYVSLEPCIMCAGLMHQARIKRCVFAAYDKKAGALKSLYNINEDTRLNHNFEVCGGVLEKESAELLKNFFKTRR